MEAENPNVKMTTEEEDDDEKICRFCFDGEEEDPLVAPCDCKGGQRYIHLSCLRQWQRMVLVSQPTHPDFWEEDVRHKKCNVCKADFTCAPPTRQELMLGFTGPEIAALISPGCIIASHESFNRKIQEQIRENPLFATLASVQHWLRGVYLITKVEEDQGEIEYPIEDARDLNKLIDDRMDDDYCLELTDGTRYQLQKSEGPLAEHSFSHKRELKSLLRSTTLPCYLVFRPTDPDNASERCTDDKVAAVNLTRPFEPKSTLKKAAMKTIRQAKAHDVDVTYFQGGPCEEDRIVACIVLGGRRTGYTVVHRDGFKTALLMAKRNATQAQQPGRNHIAVGQDVVLQGLCKRPDLNGRRGLVQAFDEKQGRFEVRLFEDQQQDNQAVSSSSAAAATTSSVDIKLIKPDNLVAHASGIGKHGTVLAFCGDARWTRVQLLGEIAKTSWGLCQAHISDLLIEPSERYDSVFGRLVYSPVTEMSDETARENMVALRRGAVEAAQYVQEEGE